ncbi:MAG: M14 family zinc carboxypeptidase [Planctomycetota bacterium]
MRTVLIVLATQVSACVAPGEAVARRHGPPRTVPESSSYDRTCSHAELLAFLDEVDAARDPRVVRLDAGTTPGGRELPLLVVADPPVADAASARRDARPRVLVMANIHAGEVEGKEACLELLREVVWGAPDSAGSEPYPVRDVILLLLPIYNADGNDAFGPDHRPLQNGPALTGRRPNAAGLDLNRDYMKQEAVETRLLARVLGAWDPHVVVDLHTTNGSAHGYELTYSPPLSPSAHPDLLAALEQDWLPTLRSAMRTRHGYETFDYGNFMTREGAFQDEIDLASGWRTFDHRPRFGNNYVGLRNRLAILSEAYAYADFRTRIDVTRAFVTEILRLTASRDVELVALCRRLDAETAASGAAGSLVQATEAEVTERDLEPLLLRAVEERTDPATGRVARVASGPRREVPRIPMFVRFRAVETVQAPLAYLLPPGDPGATGDDAAPGFDGAALDALELLLRRHGVRVERLQRPRVVDVEVLRLVSAAREERTFQGHNARSAVWDAREEQRTLPAGTLRVPLGQPLARVAFQLLDPRADDGLAVWNAYDAWLDAGPGTELPLYAVRPAP